MKWIAGTQHSRELDRRATEEFGIPAKVLMERAGLAVFEVVREMLPHGGRLTVFCGRGHNGGDGFVVARFAREHGIQVECLVAAEHPGELSTGASEQLSVAEKQGVEPIFASSPCWERKLEALSCRDLIVDALLGTGATGAVQGPIQASIAAINSSGVPVIAVDIPSGIHGDTGEELGDSIWACRTVTFGLPKPYLFQGIGLEHSGYWTVAEIGFPSELLQEPTRAQLLDCRWVGQLLPERLRASHKGENGSILIVAGSERMPGAASLAARSALRSGAGLVTVAGVRSVCAAVAANVPEAILLPLPEHSGVISADAARVLLEYQGRYHAALFGPGLTHDRPVLEFLAKVWQEWKTPSVIDADALNAVSEGVPMPPIPCVLTPHAGEMSRLLHRSIAEIQADRFQTVQAAVQDLRKTVLLKGPYSIVGHPEMPMLVNCTGNPGMASGGMGDVLSGVIATLLAQALPPHCAAAAGMYWHGLAGDLAAEKIGPIGFGALDVADRLPEARMRITAKCDCWEDR